MDSCLRLRSSWKVWLSYRIVKYYANASSKRKVKLTSSIKETVKIKRIRKDVFEAGKKPQLQSCDCKSVQKGGGEDVSKIF